MMTIEIDEDVFNHIKINAIPFTDTSPNMTLRRLFELDKDNKEELLNESTTSVKELVFKMLREAEAEKLNKKKTYTKSKKVDLLMLMQQGAIDSGETLKLVDYKKQPIREIHATVTSSGQLSYSGKKYSMSKLANILLNEAGFSTSSTRGPIHWMNLKGQTVSELWKESHINA